MSTKFRSDDTVKWRYKYGDGQHGSSYAVPANEGCSGTATSTTLTLASAGAFANGMLVLIHQTRGSGAGGYMLNKIVSGGGTTTLTLEIPLDITYTDSGNNQAQILELKQYENLVAGTVSAPAWDGSKGGILAWLDKATTTINAVLTLKSFGFLGGISPLSGSTGFQGEGTTGAAGQTNVANGNGGGAGNDFQNQAGAGGGHAVAASNTTGGISGGTAFGNAELTLMVFGGAGGAMGSFGGIAAAKYGGDSAGILLVIAKDIVVSTGSVNLGGDNGGTKDPGGNNVGAGGGAGGACLFKCETASLGTNVITAPGGTGGTGGSANKTGTAGAVGRINIDYARSVTGTTNPTANTRLDKTLLAGNSGAFFVML